MENNFKRLEQKVIKWGESKGILSKSLPIKQYEKTLEEISELKEALVAQLYDKKTFINSKGVELNTDKEIKDAIGDVVVTLIIQCEMQGLKITDCLEYAYNEIKDRKGRMINGAFVKDEL